MNRQLLIILLLSWMLPAEAIYGFDCGTYVYQGTKIADIPRNGTKTVPVTFAGSLDQTGKCKPESRYVDMYGTFNDVLVTGFIEIEMKNYIAKINLEADKLQLSTGVVSKQTCINPDGSSAYWSLIETGECGMNKYSVIYDRYMNKVRDPEETEVIYSLESEDHSFALMKK
ncbi:hypothetical protein TKK_0010194 [Trichogramma kaykai]